MSKTKRIVIVGGVAGGASAAARARRLSEDAEIVMFERGPYISFANCGLPYHIGGQIKDRDRLLVQTPEKMNRRFAIDVRTRSEVTAIDREKRQVTVRDVAEGREYQVGYDALILSPGAEPVRPRMPGIDSPRVFTLRSIPDMDAIKAVIDREGCERAVVVGGGYIGLEMAEALIERGLAVSLVELESNVMGSVDPEMAAPLHEELRLHGVDLQLGTSVTEVAADGDAAGVLLSNGTRITADLVIMAVGVRPEVKLAQQAGLELGKRGGIVVNEQMQTNDPHVYAVGDAVEVTDHVGAFSTVIPLAGPANRQGRIAVNTIFGRDSKYTSTQGTAICKVFNLAVATTGMNEKNLKRQGMTYEKVYVHPANHAGYYPGASQLSLKLLFDPKTGKILGAQCVGAKGVDKRIDVLAVALRAGMTVYDLQDLELCYAPPFGSAKDPINYAGFVAANFITGDMPICQVADVIEPRENQRLIDVRTPGEVQAGTIPGAINIPIDELRDRLDEIPKDKELLIFCQVGLRGYLAVRILNQRGFNARNLTGGYKTYCATVGFTDGKASLSADMKSDTGEVEPQKKTRQDAGVVKHIDATGMQCPGPILRLKEEIEMLSEGQALTIAGSDPGFPGDVEGWCRSTGHRLLAAQAKDGGYTATVEKRTQTASAPVAATRSKNKTIVVFSGDFDKAMASFIIANGAAAMGSDVTLFFTFWALNLLRRPESVPVHKTFIERMFGFMMPRGAERTSLSKMNMAGMGTRMIKGIMKKKNVSSLSELIAKAKAAGVRLVACTMTMDLMGIKREELIDGVEEGGVAMYLDRAETAGVNLFI
jgi:NADPH-dependent 2,4-dienoyl-CoA reductase/sulfur reductase-like enzyme/peroxiredoxin family protein/rhodanese-related sulfurtransferase/TusA-related sulfurtransferase